jgi:hypothetical protein
MMNMRSILNSLFATIFLLVLASCKAKAPDFSLSEDFEYVMEKNGTTIREVEITQFVGAKFVGKKYIYKVDSLEGSSKVFLFDKTAGYYYNGDSINLRKASSYRIRISTLGFKDTLNFVY